MVCLDIEFFNLNNELLEFVIPDVEPAEKLSYTTLRSVSIWKPRAGIGLHHAILIWVLSNGQSPEENDRKIEKQQTICQHLR